MRVYILVAIATLSLSAHAETLCVYASASSQCDGTGATTTFNGFSSLSWGAGAEKVSGGDTLYVAGTFTDSLVVNSNGAGSASARTSLRFDGPTSGVIDKRKDMTEALTAGNWTNESGSIWYLDLSSYTYTAPYRVWVNGTEVFPAQGKGNLGTQYGGSGPVGLWWYDSGNIRLYYYSVSNPATGLTSFKTLVATNATCDYAGICMNGDGVDYFDIINPTIYGGNLAGIYNLAGDNNRIYGTDVANCVMKYGTKGVLIADASTVGTGDMSNNVEIRYCTISTEIPDSFAGATWQNLMGAGNAISFQNGVNNSIAEHNLISGWQHAGIDIVCTLGSGVCTGNVFQFNDVSCDTGNSYCRGFGIDGADIGDATRNQIGPGNTFDGHSIRNQLNGDHNTVVANLFKNYVRSTVSGSETSGQVIDQQGYAGPSSFNKIIYNKFINNDSPCYTISGTAGNGNATKSGNIVVNNDMSGCGASSWAPSGLGGTAPVGTSIAIIDDVAAGANIFLNNNATGDKIYYRGSGAISVSSFNSCASDTCSGNRIDSSLTDNGEYIFPCMNFEGGSCLDRPDIGISQDMTVPYGYTLKPKKRR